MDPCLGAPFLLRDGLVAGVWYEDGIAGPLGTLEASVMSQSSLEAGDSDEVSSTSIGVEDCWEDRGLVWKAVREDCLVRFVVVGLVGFLWVFDSGNRFSGTGGKTVLSESKN